MGYDSLCCTVALTCNFSYSDAMEIKKKYTYHKVFEMTY